ncbi:MAG: hypothetical protein NTW86_29575, partial [Candidatus Sumerlaeota bacterium]|nr:hypothetical protein [Candidatus Sumerlaeota bacterium]
SHVQLPPQTLLSLKQCAPDVIELAQRIRREGRLKFMGTFFSESIAQCQDEMSALEAAELGCGIASKELGAELEGFFLQEVAYTPQLPWIINKLGVQWTILRDWEGSLKPFWIEGLDGSRCVGVPMLEAAARKEIMANPSVLPDNALLVTHCDMEIPVTIKVMHDLERFLREQHGFDTEWVFVSEYLSRVALHTVKRPTPCTNKPEDSAASPSFSRWCADHLSMKVHEATLAAMEARRAASLTAFGRRLPKRPSEITYTRPYSTWDVENPGTYPELDPSRLTGAKGAPSPFKAMATLIAWGSNSDARGWYPMLERRIERVDSFREAELAGDALTRQAIEKGKRPKAGNAGLYVVNAHGVESADWVTFLSGEKEALLDGAGNDAVRMIRRAGAQWELHARLVSPPYSTVTYRKARSERTAAIETAGDSIANGALTASFRDGGLTISRPGRPDMRLTLDPFRIHVKCLDTELRDPRPENDWATRGIEGACPRLIATRQLDYHIHFRAEYTLDGDRIFAEWRFWFTYPTLVDALDHFDRGGPLTDFTPGGLCASLSAGSSGEVWYDVPFGVSRHPNAEASFIAPVTHAFLANAAGGAALVSQSGSQSFQSHAAQGRIGVCMGKSLTSGGRRKLYHRVGERIDNYDCDRDWYKEYFDGELVHRFVILPFDGDWREAALPNHCRALAMRPRVLETSALAKADGVFAELSPANVRLA